MKGEGSRLVQPHTLHAITEHAGVDGLAGCRAVTKLCYDEHGKIFHDYQRHHARGRWVGLRQALGARKHFWCGALCSVLYVTAEDFCVLFDDTGKK